MTKHSDRCGPLRRTHACVGSACLNFVLDWKLLYLKMHFFVSFFVRDFFAAFPVSVCEVRLERDAQKRAWSLGRVFFEGTDPSNNIIIPTDPRSVLIYGDTGLRIKPTNLGLGKCEDSPYSVYGIKQCPFNFTQADVNLTEVDGDFQPLQNWHFDDMLKVAADQHDDLDLAIHVGDYVYRQGPCPTQLDLNGDCVGINGPTSFSLNDLNGTTINFEPGNWGYVENKKHSEDSASFACHICSQ